MRSVMDRARLDREFLQRYRDCLIALDAYMSEAYKMCDLLAACNGNAGSVLAQVDLVAQRDRENCSYSDYQRARKRLLHFARLSSSASLSRED